MSIVYTVPVIRQTKTNICWHAAAEMIWAFWQNKTKRMGPMNTIPTNWDTNSGFGVSDFILLAKKVGLKPVSPVAHHYTGRKIEQLLKKHGPLFVAISVWPHGTPIGHVIVLTGISGQTIYLNDPGMGGQKLRSDVAWFNEHLARNVKECLMYKNPRAY